MRRALCGEVRLRAVECVLYAHEALQSISQVGLGNKMITIIIAIEFFMIK